MVLYHNFMIVGRGTEVIIGIHSLNRNLPTPFHRKSQAIESHSFLDEIYELRNIQTSFYGLTTFLIVGSKNIELIKFPVHP